MAYDYTCDAQLAEDCQHHGNVPAIAGQFREAAWLTDEFGGRAQDLGYDLHDTLTICPECALAILR